MNKVNKMEFTLDNLSYKCVILDYTEEIQIVLPCSTLPDKTQIFKKQTKKKKEAIVVKSANTVKISVLFVNKTSGSPKVTLTSNSTESKIIGNVVLKPNTNQIFEFMSANGGLNWFIDALGKQDDETTINGKPGPNITISADDIKVSEDPDSVTVSENLIGLKTDIDSVGNDVNTLKETTANMQTTIGYLQTDVDGTKTSIENLKTNVGNLSADLDATKDDLNEAKSNIENLQSDLDATKTDLDNTKTDLNATKSDLADTKTDLANTKTDLANTKTDLADTKSDVSALQTEVSEVKTDVSGVHDEISGIHDDITSLHTDVNTVQSNLDAAVKDINDNLPGNVMNIIADNVKNSNIVVEPFSI